MRTLVTAEVVKGEQPQPPHGMATETHKDSFRVFYLISAAS